jgi:hypothetical protein
MCPCSPLDVSLDLPDGPSGPSIPGFGSPFVLNIGGIPFPEGFPEDLLELLDKLKMLIPSGTLKPALNLNFGKDIFDAIMKLLDQFLPFLMLYKFFLPILNIIICIIEVLCALKNPFKLVRAIKRLFRKCIPAFLNLFPIFALIIMLISLLMLLLALIKYIIEQILKFIKAILRNIRALYKAFTDADEYTVLAIAKKLGALLCVFQNLFVLLSLFAIIFQIIKDILALSFSIPPCDDSNVGDIDDCSTCADVCPTIVKSEYTRQTGSLQYLNKVGVQTSIVLPAPFNNLNFDIRQESIQLWDVEQEIGQAFKNIYDGYDVPVSPKPVFFPTDVAYSATTSPKQAAYTVDLRMFYNPSSWGRSISGVTGTARYIRFKDCIVTKVPTANLIQYDNTYTTVSNGVILLAGGLGYEDDGTTVLTGYSTDGVTPITDQATLENFVHIQTLNTLAPVLSPTDGYTFSNVEYTFKPHIEVLISKDLVTLGCEPTMAFDKAFINDAFAGDIGLRTALLNDLINGNSFPDPSACQECLSTALAGLRANLTAAGVATFQATALTCLQKLEDDTNSSLSTLVGIGFDPCSSKFDATPKLQFTSKSIKVKVDLNERNGLSLTSGAPVDMADGLASRLKGIVTHGEISTFSYDGYQSFEAEITATTPGTGQLMVMFDNNIFCTNNIPEDTDESPSHNLQTIDYQFVYAPASQVGISDITQPRRDEGDVARDSSGGEVV